MGLKVAVKSGSQIAAEMIIRSDYCFGESSIPMENVECSG